MRPADAVAVDVIMTALVENLQPLQEVSEARLIENALLSVAYGKLVDRLGTQETCDAVASLIVDDRRRATAAVARGASPVSAFRVLPRRQTYAGAKGAAFVRVPNFFRRFSCSSGFGLGG